MIGKNSKPCNNSNRENNHHILKSLLYIICLDQVAMTLTFPLITLIFFDTQSSLLPPDTSFATRSMWYGLANALPNLLNIFFSPLLSALSDVFGRKKILLLEIGSGSLFGLLLALGIYFSNLTLVMLAFVIRGSFARSNPTALAIIGDSTTAENKIAWMAYLQFAISVGAFFGPIIGGYIAARYFFPVLNYAFAFFVVAGIALITTALACKYIRETARERIAIRFIHLHALKQTIMHSNVLRISLILLLIQLAWSTFYQFIPPLLKTSYHFNHDQLGLYFGIISLWLIIASGPLIKRLRHFCNAHQLLVISIYLVASGFCIIFCALLGVVTVSPTYLLWLSAIPIAIGDVISFICLTTHYSNAAPAKAQGSVMGFCFIVTRAAWAASSLIGGYLLAISPLILFLMGFICIITALWLTKWPFWQMLYQSSLGEA